MSISFRDFAPAITKPSGLFSNEQRETIEAVVKRVNEWIAKVNAQVINVETVLIPNATDPAFLPSQLPVQRTSGDVSSYWMQVVRVWHKLP